MMKIQKTSKLAKLSIAALLLGVSISAAQEVPAGAAPAPTAEPVAVPVEAPVAQAPAPAPAPAPTPAPVYVETAPVAAAVEPAPAAKPAETLSATVAGTKISLYGRLELNAAYETDVTSGLWSWSAPSAAQGDAQGRTSLSAARTRFGFNLEGPSKDNEPTLKGKFEADFAANEGYGYFNGASGAFRLRQSWGSLNFKDAGLTLLFGQTDDVVNPLDPPAVNPSSFNGSGNLGNRRPQIRITEAIGPIEIAVAATHDRIYDYVAREDKDVGTQDTLSVSAANNAPALPAFQGRLGLKLPATWAGEKANLALGIGGLYGTNKFASNTDKEYDAPESSYMFGADLSLPLIDILTLTGEFFTGQNLSRYGDASLKQSRAYNKDGGIQSIGWWGALAAKLPSNISVGAGAGAESLDDKSKSAGKPENNMFIFANLAYNFTSAAKLTLEYVNFATDYTTASGSDDASLNRFELNFRYDFK